MPQSSPQTRRDAANQRNAVLAGFLGWTLDAFDFFVLTFVINDVAKSFGKSRPDIALTITLALAMRPLGAIIFGIMADHWGRRLPLMLNVLFYAIISVLSGLAPTYGTFLLLRMLFGMAMGGEWGVGASLALESVSPRWRGLFSGLLQEGYAMGNLLAALAFRFVYPWAIHISPTDGWRAMFFIGGLPALLSLFIRARVKESEAWHENRTDWPTYRRSLLQNWKRFLYLVALLAMMNFISHGTQDMYPTFLQRQRLFSPEQTANITMISMFGAVLGGLAFGYYSDRGGRRKAMTIAILCALAMVPVWIAAPRHGADRHRRVPDAVLRAGRVGRRAGAHQRAVAGEPARLLPRLRVPDRRAVRVEHHLLRSRARRALHLRAVDGGAGRDGDDRRRDRHAARPGSARRRVPEDSLRRRWKGVMG